MTTAPETRGPPRGGDYVIAMALGFVFAYALGLGLAFLGWGVAENEFLVMVGFGLMSTGWLLGPLVAAGVIYFRKARTEETELDVRSSEAGPRLLVSLAENHLRKGEFFLVLATLGRAQHEAVGRDDVASLEAASELATRVLAAPGVHPQIRDDAQEFVGATHEQIAALRAAAVAEGENTADADSVAIWRQPCD